MQAQSVGAPVWAKLAPMPLARQEISSAALDGRIFVIAGFNSDGGSTSDVQVFDLENGWSLGKPLPVANNHNGAAVAGGRLYSFGGVSNRAFVYNSAADSWTEVAPMRFEHGNTAAVGVIDNRIYVAGGTGSGMIGNELEVYDPVANTWTVLASMAVPRNHCAGGAINGRFYVAGGRGSDSAADALEVYDPVTNSWERLASMPTGRSGVAAGVVDGELYVFGGEMPRLFGEVEVYDPVQNRWRQLAPMPTPRHGIFAAVFDNAIHLAGGATRQGLGPTTTHEVFLVNGGNADYYPCPNFQYTRIVPIVLDVTTGSAHFTTEMTLINTGIPTGFYLGPAVHLSLHYTASLGDQLGSGTVTDVLANGEQKVIPNVLSYLRDKGLPLPPSSSAPQQGGVLTITFTGYCDATIGILARTTAITQPPQPDGAAGLAYTGLPSWNASTRTATVYGLRANSQDRSNLAIYNPSTDPVTVKVVAFSGAGDGASSVVSGAETLPGLGWRQYNNVLAGAGIAQGWVTVERTSNTGAFGAYGVVNDNVTNDGSFVLPTIGAANRLTVPVLVENTGFASELILSNRGSSNASFRLNYRESSAPELGAGGTGTVALGPHEQRIIPDAIDFLRRQGMAVGPRGTASYAGSLQVIVEGANSVDIFAAARTLAPSPAGGRFGVFTPAVFAGQEAFTRAYLFGLRSDANHRTNVALLNNGTVNSDTITLEVQFVDADRGTGLPIASVTLSPGQWTHLLNPLAERGAQNGWATIVRKAGSSPWVAYAVINDGGAPGQRTGDGAFFLATVP
jgi:N-acetylneuraminic acid mutarotase